MIIRKIFSIAYQEEWRNKNMCNLGMLWYSLKMDGQDVTNYQEKHITNVEYEWIEARRKIKSERRAEIDKTRSKEDENIK